MNISSKTPPHRQAEQRWLQTLRHFTIMKQLLFFLLLILVGQLSFAQNNGPKEITPQVLQKIKAEVEKLVLQFKKNLSKEDLTTDQIEFSVDTFRIRQVVSKRMDIDYSTVGINITVDEMTYSYDKLMNKYYNKLLKILKPEDKKVLVTAQKAWLAYRDAEAELIGTMTEYSGGGTIQSNIATGSYSELVVKRAVEIFNYYDGIFKEK
jgi:uncharacterized protein YecT (DUF1311 family)